MLRKLHIENYILIDSLDVEFPEGLVIITGQTGAGKSILLGAISLLSGVKCDASNIAAGAETCVVEAEFEVGADSPVAATLEENGIDFDGSSVIIRRVFSRSGRSRSFVNDIPANASALQELCPRLVDIHSQYQSRLLTDRRFQLSLLDGFAGVTQEASQCRALWRRLRDAQKELDELLGEKRTMERDREYYAAQLQQLKAARLSGDELPLLEEKQRKLSNAQAITEGLQKVISVFRSEQDGGCLVSLKESCRQLDALSGFLPAAAELSSRMESARIELDDICGELENCYSDLEESSESLESVEERMSLIYSLLKKHSCSDEKQLIALRDSLEASLKGMDDIDGRIEDARKAVEDAGNRYRQVSSSLHEARAKAAPQLSAKITSELEFLEMEKAVFRIELGQLAQPCADGSDEVSFLFSSDGAGLKDVSACASGGEISRIMLCLKSTMASFAGLPTQIFDEIDTGVSGSVASRMGSMICSMGKVMQVFAITHLPQVAAKGMAHYMVEKSSGVDGRTVSRLSEVTGESRVREIARLLSGEKITSQALENAKSLLDGN